MSDTTTSAVGTHTFDDSTSPGCGGTKVAVTINEGKGDKGDAATITVGDTTTLDAGEKADVKNTGTSSAAVLEFFIPKGDKGDPGDDATVTADTVIATTTNPKATLGQVTDAALAAVPKSAVGAQNGVQGTDKLGVIAVVNTTSGKVVGGSGLAGVATADKETGDTTGIKSLGETLADMQIAQAATDERTASIDAHSGEYTGSLDSATVSDPNAQNTETKLPDVLSRMVDDMETIQDGVKQTGQTVTNMATDLTAVVKQAADLSEDGSAYTGDVSGANVTVEASDGQGGTIPQKITVSAAISSLGAEILWLSGELIPKSDIGAADGVLGLDAKAAIATLVTDDDNGAVTSGAGTAKVVLFKADGITVKSTSSLGSLLATVLAASTAFLQKTSALSVDGQSYTGAVDDATVTVDPGTGTPTAITILDLAKGVVTALQQNMINKVKAATYLLGVDAATGTPASYVGVNPTAALDGSAGRSALLTSLNSADGVQGTVASSNGGVIVNTGWKAPANLTDAGTLHEIRYDDVNGIMYRCTLGGAAGAAKWQAYYATSNAPIVPGANGNTVDEVHLTLADGSKLDYTEEHGLTVSNAQGNVVGQFGPNTQRLVHYAADGTTVLGSLILNRLGVTINAQSLPLNLNPSVAAPATPTDAGSTGEIRFDANYMYRKTTSTSNWVRFPIDTTWT